VGPSEYSFHAHELDSTKKRIPISLLNEHKAKYSCGVRPACPNTEDFTQLESPVVKFSVNLSEYSFHAHELDSTEKFVPIPFLNEDKAKYSCGVKPSACPNTENITPLEPQGVKFSMALPEDSFHGKEPNSREKSAPIPLLNTEKAKYTCGVGSACPNTENITPVEPPVVKFSRALPEHSFHAKEPNSYPFHF
jgi:hypothetical protein